MYMANGRSVIIIIVYRANGHRWKNGAAISLGYMSDRAPLHSVVVRKVLVPTCATDAHADRSNKEHLARENDIA